MIRFVAVAICVYSVLTLACRSGGEAFAEWSCRRLAKTLNGGSGPRDIEVPAEQPVPSVIQLVLVNRNLMASDGSGPVRNVEVPAALFWNGTALFLALSLATPRRWPLRLAVTAGGALAVQAFTAAAVCCALWNEGSHLALSRIAPGWGATATRLQDGMAQLTGLAVPVLIWLLSFWPLGKGKAAALRF